VVGAARQAAVDRVPDGRTRRFETAGWENRTANLVPSQYGDADSLGPNAYIAGRIGIYPDSLRADYAIASPFTAPKGSYAGLCRRFATSVRHDGIDRATHVQMDRRRGIPPEAVALASMTEFPNAPQRRANGERTARSRTNDFTKACMARASIEDSLARAGKDPGFDNQEMHSFRTAPSKKFTRRALIALHCHGGTCTGAGHYWPRSRTIVR